MTTFTPAYRMTVYAPRTTDSTETTVLTPIGGAIHSDDFKVATISGVSGFQSYLASVEGRTSALDPLTKRVSTGEITCTLLDARTTAGGTNLERWVTAFLGGADDRARWMGLKVYVEESLDGGTTWASFFTGRIQTARLAGKVRMAFTVRGMLEDLKQRLFVGIPDSSASYAQMATLLPHGFPVSPGYDGYSTTAATNGTSQNLNSNTGAFRIRTSTTQGTGAGHFRVLSAGLADILEGINPTNTIESVGIDLVRGMRTVFRQTTGIGSGRDTHGLQPRFYRIPSGIQNAIYARVKHTSGGSSGSTGTYVLTGVELEEIAIRDTVVPFVKYLDFHALYDANNALDTGHSEYLAAPANGVTVEVTLTADDRPTKNAPLYIDSVALGTLWKDLLDGYYSTLDSSGNAQFAVAYDSSLSQPGRGRGGVGFTALIADTSVPTQRMIIEGGYNLREFLTNHICQPSNFAYRENGDGELVPVDCRMPADISGLDTIDDDDLVEGESVGWLHDRSTAVSEVRVTVYEDSHAGGLATPRLLRNIAIEEIPAPDLGTINPGDQPLVIDAIGLRASFGQLIQNITERIWVSRKARELAEELRSPFSGGAMTAELVCYRNSTAEDWLAGDLKLVNVSVLPDPQTNERGGTRVMRCTERSIRGAYLVIRALDLGVNAQADAPTLGAVAQETGNTKHGVTSVVTRNGASDPVHVQFAVTSTATGSRPAEGSALWTFGARTTAGGTVTIRELPSNSRIWLRGRSEPDATQSPTMPSDWAFPSGSGYVDTAAITAPSGLTQDSISATTVTYSWTNGDTAYAIVVEIDGTQYAVLDVVPGLGPGTQYTAQKLSASTTYNSPGFEVFHRDPYGGVSASDTDSFTTTGTQTDCPDPGGPVYFLVGDPV